MASYREQFQNYCADQVERVPDFAGKTGLSLDQHQQDAMIEVSQALDSDIQAFSIVHSCGAGKTILEANLLLASQRAKQVLSIEGKDLIITTERALIHGVRDECLELGLDIGVWGGGVKDIDNHPVVLASIQSLQNNHKQLGRYLPLDELHLLVGDEADKYLTKKRKELLLSFRNAIRVGFTATPSWSDGRDISDLWGRKIHHMPLKEGILKGVNIPSYYHLFEASLDDSELTLSRGDYNKSILASALKSAEIQKAIPDVYETLIPEEQRKKFPTLVFVPSTELVEQVAADMNDRYAHKGLCIKSWTGSTISSKQMQNDVEAFNAGQIDVLVLCEMGGRGLNLPRARCLIDAHSTLSKNKLEQRLSRVMRKVRSGSQLAQENFEKEFALVAQIIPRSNKFRPCLLPDLLGWEQYKDGELLGGSSNTASNGDRDEKAQEELQTLKQYIESQNPSHYVEAVREIDIYRELKLRDELPQADSQGFFFLPVGEGDHQKMIKYATIYAWSKVLPIGEGKMNERLQDYQGITAIDANGSIHTHAFYSEIDLQEICADLLQDLPQADKHGFFIISIDGVEKTFGMLHCWAPIIKVTEPSIKKRLQDFQGMTARDSRGTIRKNAFYEESVIRSHCSDLSDELPRLDKEGFVMLPFPMQKEDELSHGKQNTEKYSSIKIWARVYSTTYTTIKKYLNDLQGIAGRTHRGQKVSLYPESLILKHCKDLIDLPQVDASGFFSAPSPNDPEEKMFRYATTGTWARHFNQGPEKFVSRMKGVQGISGRDGRGRCHKHLYYSESQIRNRCSDILPDENGKCPFEDLPQVGEDGFIIQKNEDTGKEIKYASIEKWASYLNVSRKSLRRLLKPFTGISAISVRGRVFTNTYYKEKLVRELCVDLINDFPRTNKDGFLPIDDPEQNSERIGNLWAWGRTLQTTASTLGNLLDPSKGLEGKDYQGKPHLLYPESVLRETCSYFFDAPRANKEGFFHLTNPINPNLNERYGTIGAWGRELEKNHHYIKKRLGDELGRDGFDGKGTYRNCGFYSESTIRQHCEELMENDQD
jgi:superfamily II DNA or RNA helicase/AraC-like DNA-binding protein